MLKEKSRTCTPRD